MGKHNNIIEKKKKTKKACPFIIFSPTKQRGKTKANKVQAKTVHFSQNPNVNHRNQLNKQGERVQKGKR